jgi:hypothetical protein
VSHQCLALIFLLKHKQLLSFTIFHWAGDSFGSNCYQFSTYQLLCIKFWGRQACWGASSFTTEILNSPGKQWSLNCHQVAAHDLLPEEWYWKGFGLEGLVWCDLFSTFRDSVSYELIFLK